MRHRRTTEHENVIQGGIVETGQSMVQAWLETDCGEVGILPVRTQIPHEDGPGNGKDAEQCLQQTCGAAIVSAKEAH
jgi:hypothetical protein